MKNIFKISLDKPESVKDSVHNFFAAFFNFITISLFCLIFHGAFLYTLIFIIKFGIIHFGLPFGLTANWIFTLDWKFYIIAIVIFEMHYSNFISEKALKSANEIFKEKE